MNDLNLGDRVTVKAQYTRQKRGPRRRWVAETQSERSAIFVGWRHLANGYMENYDGSQGCAEWRPQETIKAALVVFNERKNPVYVPVDAIKKIEAQP